MKSYMTKDGTVNLKAVEFVMRSIGRMEDAIFKKRRQEECQRRIRDERRKNQDRNKRINRNQVHETRELTFQGATLMLFLSRRQVRSHGAKDGEPTPKKDEGS